MFTKTTAVTRSTTEILDSLTEASMTADEQDCLLKPIQDTEVHHALNRYGDLMNEQHIPRMYCSVCACKHIPSKIKRILVDNIPSFLLLAKGPTHKTVDITGDWVLLNDAIYKKGSSECVLSKNVHISNISECEIDICKLCLKELKNESVPARSLASFDTGPIPESLQNVRLTFAERMFLSVNMTVFNIYRIENPTGKNRDPHSKARVSKGHCISFKHSNTQDIINKHILPHNPEMLPKLMVTSYIGPAKTAEQAKKMVQNSKQLTVRTSIVHLFAREYARMNPNRILHDKNRLSNHRTGTVPEIIIKMLDYESLVEPCKLGKPTFVDLDRAMHDDYAKRDQLRPDEKADPKIQIVQTSGMVVPHLLSNGLDELKDAGVCNLNGNILAIPTDKTPVSDYNVRYFVDNYPNIFLYGLGERPAHVSLEVYLETLMRRGKIGAATDYSFPFEARNVLQRHRTLKKVRLSVTMENSALIPNIDDNDFGAALKAIQNKEPVNDRVQALLNQLQISGADLRGTPQRLNRYRQQILTGLYPLFGPFDVWITLNIQESSSQVLLRIAGEQEVPISYDVPPNVPNISRRMQICAENPMSVAQFFHVFMKAFLDALLGLPHNTNDLTPTHKGVFGWVQAYMFILEVSGKGTGPHAHGQIKVKGLNRDKVLQRFHDPVFVEIYKQYMLAAFTQDLPNREFDVAPPTQCGQRNNLIRKRMEDEHNIRYANPRLIKRAEEYMGMYPLRRMPFKNNEASEEDNLHEYTAKRLIRIIRECGIHEHSPTCKKNNHAGDDKDCRMFYPQPLNEEIRIDLDEHIDLITKDLVIDGIDVELQRDHPFVVAYNKWVTLALASNTAIYYMPSGKEGRTKALYVTDYSTKKPLSAYECIALFRASLQAKKKMEALKNTNPIQISNDYFKSSTVVNRCLNALSGEIIISGYECCAEIGDFPDNYSSNQFVPFSGWSYMYNMLGEKTKQYFHIIQQKAREKNSSETTLVSLVEDYIHLDIPDNKKMTVYEFVAFYTRARKDNKRKKSKESRDSDHMDSSEESEEDIPESSNMAEQRRGRGRPMHDRIKFKTSHKLHTSHYVIRMAKMKVPYQVGRQYPRRPAIIDEPSKEKAEVYAKYILSIFKPWSTTMKAKTDDSATWWSTLIQYMSICPLWIKSIIRNMHISLERDNTLVKAKNGMDRVSCNTMNHANKKFDIHQDDEIDWHLHPNELAELLRDLESEQMVQGMNFTRPLFAGKTRFVQDGLAGLAVRFKDTLEGNSFSTSSTSICGNNESAEQIQNCWKKWKVALQMLIECNSNGLDYEMPNEVNTSDFDPQSYTQQKLNTFLTDPWFVSRPESNFDIQFRETDFRPDWTILPNPPSIVETLRAWHLTKKQAEFAILVLHHFHATLSNSSTDQLLAQCLGPPGTGKLQTLLAILWHMSQHNKQDKVATCAFTGGAAMLISTPYTRPMTTCRQFQITLKGPNTSHKAITVLTQRVKHLQYVFIDEFSFISYKHITEIAGQIVVALGEKCRKDLPFGGMNMAFTGDYEQLAKPMDYPIYYGAHAEQTVDPEHMNIWFMRELELNRKKTSYDPSITYLGRNLWTSIDKVKTLTVQKRQDDTKSGRRLLQRCETLRKESFNNAFFDSLQKKAIGMENGPDLQSQEWNNPLYIVMRHSLRVPIDFNEAKFQANLRCKRFVAWKAIDTIYKKPLPEPLQLIVNDMNFEKVAKWQYYYEGMAIAFLDNKYFDAGNATNNIGYAFSLTLNPLEPPDDISKPYRMLKFLPETVLVYVPNSRIKQLCPDLPLKVIPMKPEPQTKQVRLGDDRYCLQNGKRISTVTVTRLAMRWMGVHAVTQYFSQGMTLAGRKCIIDLRIPVGGSNDFSQSVMVMLSRHRSDNDWALLHPLWTPGNALERTSTIASMTKLLKRDKDLDAELKRIQRVETQVTDPQIQNILESHPELAAYLENAQT